MWSKRPVLRPSTPSAPNCQTSNIAARKAEQLRRCCPAVVCATFPKNYGSDVTETRYLSFSSLFSSPPSGASKPPTESSWPHDDDAWIRWVQAFPPAASQTWLWSYVAGPSVYPCLELLTPSCSPRTTSPTSKISDAIREAPNRGWPTSNTSFSMARYRSKRSSWRGHASSCPGRTSCGRW
jgi:hypothetical protein